MKNPMVVTHEMIRSALFGVAVDERFRITDEVSRQFRIHQFSIRMTRNSRHATDALTAFLVVLVK